MQTKSEKVKEALVKSCEMLKEITEDMDDVDARIVEICIVRLMKIHTNLIRIEMHRKNNLNLFQP